MSRVEARIMRGSVIRVVTKAGRDGRPKVARDRRTKITMERVKAQADRPCHYKKCKYVMIYGGTEYARVTDQMTGFMAAARYYPKSTDYHFTCVPPEARPLVRFFK